MYAVIRTGGKQYRVEPNERLQIDRLDAEPGATVDIDEVLVIGEGETAHVGTPLVSGASVKLEVLEQGRDDKIVVFKKKRRQNYRRKHGHQQDITVVRVAEIAGPDGMKAADDGAKKSKPKTKAKAKKTKAADETDDAAAEKE